MIWNCCFSVAQNEHFSTSEHRRQSSALCGSQRPRSMAQMPPQTGSGLSSVSSLKRGGGGGGSGNHRHRHRKGSPPRSGSSGGAGEADRRKHGKRRRRHSEESPMRERSRSPLRSQIATAVPLKGWVGPQLLSLSTLCACGEFCVKKRSCSGHLHGFQRRHIGFLPCDSLAQQKDDSLNRRGLDGDCHPRSSNFWRSEHCRERDLPSCRYRHVWDKFCCCCNWSICWQFFGPVIDLEEFLQSVVKFRRTAWIHRCVLGQYASLECRVQATKNIISRIKKGNMCSTCSFESMEVSLIAGERRILLVKMDRFWIILVMLTDVMKVTVTYFVIRKISKSTIWVKAFSPLKLQKLFDLVWLQNSFERYTIQKIIFLEFMWAVIYENLSSLVARVQK